MSNPRDDYFGSQSKSRMSRSSPGVDSQTSGLFQTGQGGRTVLPPISSAFPSSHFLVPTTSYPIQYPQQDEQQRPPGQRDYNAPKYHHQNEVYACPAFTSTEERAEVFRTAIAYESQQPSPVLQASDIGVVVSSIASQSNGTGIGNFMENNSLLLSCFPNDPRRSVNVRDLTDDVYRLEKFHSASGGSSDVWEGYFKTDQGRVKVAVKVPRTHIENPHRSKDELQIEFYMRRWNELGIWSLLSHDNVVPLLGTASGFGNPSPFGRTMSLVCSWMENGDLTGYLQRVEASLTLPRCFEIIQDVASGLSYIHSMSIVHGDISGSNILIDGDGKALLSDFGLSAVVSNGNGGTPRWAAPERFRICKSPSLTTACDIYSYGGIMVHVLSGKIPYHQLKNDAQILLNMDKPERPLHERVTDAYWNFILACWRDQPDQRPEATKVLERIKKFGQELV